MRLVPKTQSLLLRTALCFHLKLEKLYYMYSFMYRKITGSRAGSGTTSDGNGNWAIAIAFAAAAV